ncbi:MAG: wax ester/triacylglycerol synthase family O-acyltransferase, partial [Streptosporangiaceae bacterium]
MTPTATNRMSTLDTEFYFAEHANVPLHMGSVAVFEGPVPEHRELTRLFAAKLPLVPRYRQVVSTAPGHILRPVWADDEHFQIRHHVRRLKVRAPGGDAQLRAVATRLFTRPLDLSRPLWEEWLLTGLADGRWAILSKIHHCMADGVGGNDLMTLVFDTDPDAELPEPVSWVPAPGPSLADRAAEQVRDVVTWPLRQLAAAPETSARLKRLARPEDLLEYARGLGEGARSLAAPSATFLNGPIGPKRRWAWTTTSLTELKQIRRTHGGTINDVVLAVVAGAFRDLLAARGKLTDGLVVRSLVPVSVRGPDEAGVVTNRVSAVLANLPVSEPDPVRRLALIRAQMDSLKHRHQAVSAEVLTAMLGVSAPMWLALGTQAAYRFPQPLVQTVTTNVPGPRDPLYVLGRRMAVLYPYVPIGNSTRISIAIVSYLDTVSFGITADYDAVPDADV